MYIYTFFLKKLAIDIRSPFHCTTHPPPLQIAALLHHHGAPRFLELAEQLFVHIKNLGTPKMINGVTRYARCIYRKARQAGKSMTIFSTCVKWIIFVSGLHNKSGFILWLKFLFLYFTLLSLCHIF